MGGAGGKHETNSAAGNQQDASFPAEVGEGHEHAAAYAFRDRNDMCS